MFAKKPKVVEKKSQKRLIPAWIWMVIGSMMTLMIGVLLYLWQPFKSVRVVATPQDGTAEQQANADAEPMQEGAATTQDAVSNSANSSQANDKQANESGDGKATEQIGTQKKNYEFYDLLPEQDVTPIPDEVVVLEPDTSQPASQADVTLKQKQQAQAADDTQDEQSDTSGSTETYDGGDVLPEPNHEEAGNEQAGKKAGNADNATTSKSNSTEADDPIETMIAMQSANKSAKTAIQKSSKPSATYILQINSFGNAEDADRRRAEVLLAGIDARVVKTPVGEGEYLYQVISNVYQDKDSVFQDQERLKSSGIDALVVKRKK